jgi:peptidoglycan/xylan/chitin deacetylase (PgdA/CDA1 family)
MSRYHTLKLRKLMPVLLIISILAGGVILFAQNEDLLLNFKPYYYKSYLAAFKYNAAQLGDLTTRNKAYATGSTAKYAASIPVLVYPGAITDQPNSGGIQIDQFISQMLLLKKQGFNTISLQDYYNFVNRGEKLPDKSFLLTFDGGLKATYYPAEPILAALHYRAAMFIATNQSFNKESPLYLSTRELLKIHNSEQWELQPQAIFGNSLSNISATATQNLIRDNLANANANMTKYLGIKAVAIALPYGNLGDSPSDYSATQAYLLKETEAIYPLAFEQFNISNGKSQNYPATQAFLNERIRVLPNWSAQNLLSAITISSAKPTPFSATPSSTDGWLSTWADKTFSSQGMVLNATPKTSGAATDLDGSYGWRNYAVIASIELVKGSNFKLYLRVQNNNTYISCSYNKTYVELQQVSNGQTAILAKERAALKLNLDNNLAANVSGNVVTCMVPGAKSLTAQISNSSLTTQGGIGFSVADTIDNNAEGIIKHVEVTATR